MNQTVVQHIASLCQGRLNCQQSNSVPWFQRHESVVLKLVKSFLPSGGGFDAGTQLDLAQSSGEKLVFYTEFHHMDETGYYTGWTAHTVTVTPAFSGIAVQVSGRDKNNIKEFIAECFDAALRAELTPERFQLLYAKEYVT